MTRSIFFYVVLLLSKNLICVRCSESQPLDPSKLVLKVRDTSIYTTPKEDPSKYRSIVHESAVEYRFGGENVCAEISYDSKLVWSNETKSGPSAVYLLMDKRQIVIAEGNIWKMYSYDGSEWRSSEDITLNPIELDINVQEGDDRFLYSPRENDALYQALPPNFFKTVKSGGEIIFTTEDSIEYARNVTVKQSHSDERTVTLDLLCGDIKVARKIGREWRYEPSNQGSSNLRKTLGGIDGVRVVLIVGVVVIVLLVICLLVYCLK